MSVRRDIRDHPIRAFAVLCVAAIALFIGWMSYKLNETLAGPGWCAKAIGADRADTDSKLDVAASCVGLLTIQLKSIATNSHILFGALALCLVTLIVVVIAGARLAGKFKDAELTVGRDPVPVTVTNPPTDPVQTEEAKP